MPIPALPEGAFEEYETSKRKHMKDTQHLAVEQQEVINEFGWNLTWRCPCGASGGSKGVF